MDQELVCNTCHHDFSMSEAKFEYAMQLFCSWCGGHDISILISAE